MAISDEAREGVQRLPDRPGPSLDPPDPGRGRRLGVDVGSVRIGVAASDPDAILATPVETVSRDPRKKSDRHIRRLATLVDDLQAVEVVVGLPRTLADRAGSSARDAIEVADRLARRVAPTPVRLADERLTTVAAQRSLREAGVRARGQRAMIDQAAAVGILQNWLDQRRSALRTQGAEEAPRTQGAEEAPRTQGAGEATRTQGAAEATREAELHRAAHGEVGDG